MYKVDLFFPFHITNLIHKTRKFTAKEVPKCRGKKSVTLVASVSKKKTVRIRQRKLSDTTVIQTKAGK